MTPHTSMTQELSNMLTAYASQSALNELRNWQREKDVQIANLEREVAELRQFVQDNVAVDGVNSSAGDRKVSASDNFNMFDEMQERSTRAKNVIIYNLEESTSAVTIERINYDKVHVADILNDLELDSSISFKVIRLGKPSDSDEEFVDLVFSLNEKKTIPKIKNFIIDVLNKKQFGVSKRTFHILVEMFKCSEYFPKNPFGKCAKTTETHIAAFLWFAGNKCVLRTVAQIFNTSISTMFAIIEE
nr:unnamed protein product [Callosobruchus analis]